MRLTTTTLATALILAASATPAAQAQTAAPSPAAGGIEVQHLGVNNTLVRVGTAQGGYLMLPIQESNDDDEIKVLVDGRLDKTIRARLAKTRVDYYTPFDITPYKGHDLLLGVVTRQNRGSVREAQNDVCWRTMSVAPEWNPANTEKYRPAFHHTPQWGWMNDPNGMVYKDGVWHLYYQWNPYGSKWQNLSWGHSTSTDLVHWTPQPKAVEPDGLGMIFSGSSVLDPANTAGFGPDAIVSLYTSCDVSQIQSLAWSEDGGTTFKTYPGNPVIATDSEARDPNMFWDAKRGRWVLTLAHALDHEMLIYTSPDLKHWTLASSFGKGLGCQEGVWECPDLFELPVDGDSTVTKWVLLCNINPGGPWGGSATQYFTGDFDGTAFTPDKDAQGNVPTKWMDYGKDHYATVSWSDAPQGRRTVLGWMSNWQYANEVPTRQYRSANTLPREVGLFTAADGSLRLSSAPSPELDAMRGKATVNVRRASLSAKAQGWALPADGLCEIDLTVDPLKAKCVSLVLANDEGEKTVVTYDPAAATVSVDRTASGITEFSHDFPCVTTSPTFAAPGSTVKLRLYIDRSSIELFGNEGRFVMTNLVFPTKPYTRLSLSATQGKAKVSDLKVYPVQL